jgi:hypothetical protein
MTLWITLAVNSIALGGLLFLLSAGFSLIFGLMRIPNLMHGSFFMLGAYFGVTLLNQQVNFWVAALASGAAMAVIGAAIERLLLRASPGRNSPRCCSPRAVLHRRRPLPDDMDRRPLAAAAAARPARRGAGRRAVLPDLSAGDRRHRRRHRHRFVASGRLDPARRDDPRRRR